ncbi:M28 family peptidase [Planctomycetaceae bacterium SH139]
MVRRMKRLFYCLLSIYVGVACYTGMSGTRAYSQTPEEFLDTDVVEAIKAEGLENSKVMETISYLTDVHGPRLTGSPYSKVAAEWTLAQLAEWGIENPRLEDWGPFGRGWTLQRASFDLLEPTYAPLIAHTKAWSPSTARTVRSVPIYMDVQSEEDLEKYRGKLGRAIVLISPPRDLEAHFEPPAVRKTAEDLLRLANAKPPAARRNTPSRPTRPPAEEKPAEAKPTEAKPTEAKPTEAKPTEAKPTEAKPTEAKPTEAKPTEAKPAEAKPAEAPTTTLRRSSSDPRNARRLQAEKWDLAYSEGAAVVLEPGRGDGGNVFVSAVTMPRLSEDTGAVRNPFSRGPRPWNVEATTILPQAVMAAEHYNRLVRMIQKGFAPTVEVDILTQYYEDDQNTFNIIAEIPGTDLTDEIVMLGGHFDSWQAGTGATDNAVGCGVAMEAMRILKAIEVQPRRTIRLALWTGEEQGLLGSRAYVREHFGEIVYEESEETEGRRQRSNPTFHLKPEQGRVSAYYNLDNGTGAIRGIYLQGNEQLRSIFRTWLSPFAEMGASTVSAGNTGGTDHQSFDSIGIPGFQFIQDEVEYDTRTHHSSMDVYERVQEEDVKQASIIMATFVYHTAMRDEMLPRKPLPGPTVNVSTEKEQPNQPVLEQTGTANSE